MPYSSENEDNDRSSQTHNSKITFKYATYSLAFALLGALVFILVLFVTGSVHWNGSGSASTQDTDRLSPSGVGTGSSSVSNSSANQNQTPALTAKDLAVKSFSAKETPFDASVFLRSKFPLSKVEPNKTYGMLCRSVFKDSKGKQFEAFGLSVVHVVSKPGSSTAIQMRTVIEGCVDSTMGKALSKLRLNRDPISDALNLNTFVFDVESLASDRTLESGIQASVFSGLTSAVVYPQFCLLNPGQAIKTVTMKKLDNQETDGPTMTLLFGKIRPPQPHPIFFTEEGGGGQTKAQYVQSVGKGTADSSWFLPVGMTCISANWMYNGGYMALYFMNGTQTTLIGAIRTGYLADQSSPTQYLVNPNTGTLGLTFGSVTVP